MKRVILFGFALSLLVLMFAFALTEPAPAAQAETRTQMQLRVVAGYIDKYDLNRTCDQTCVGTREQENSWLVPLSRQLGIEHNTLTRASIGHAIDWGFSFEKLYGRPPTIDDWVYAWPSIGEDFRYKLNATPPLFKVDNWVERRQLRYAQEYGGSY